MQDNFTEDTAEKLIKYMDGELSADEKTVVENLLQNDENVQLQYQFFLASKQSVRSEGIRQRVKEIQLTYLEDKNVSATFSAKKKKRNPFFTSYINIAAILVFLLIGYGTFQYLTTTNQQVYNDAFTNYQLPVSRGNNTSDLINVFYNKGDYKSVIRSFSSIPDKTQKDYFITGLSYLQLNNAVEAVAAFQQVEALNAKKEKKRYAEETDYYLLLAYLKAGDINSAEKKLNKIRADKDHLFYEKAGTISRTKLSILKWKD